MGCRSGCITPCPAGTARKSPTPRPPRSPPRKSVMAHAHVQRPSANYYLDQLCALGCAGVIGALSVLLYTQQWLNNLLKPPFDIAVCAGGVGLLALTVARGVSLWRESG